MNHQNTFHAAFFRSRPFTFIFTLGGFFVGWIVWLIQSRTEKLTIENGKIIYSNGIISKNVVECKLERVSSVHVRQSLGQLIFGCGDIVVTTSGDVPEIIALGFVDVKKIKQIIDDQSN